MVAPITAKVKGNEKLAAEMLKMAEALNTTIQRTVPMAAGVAAKKGAELCKPGEKMRKIVRRSRGAMPNKKQKSDRTDTSRYATHFVMFRRQGKKPFFVPVYPNPHSVHFSPAPGREGPSTQGKDHAAARQSEARRRNRVYTPGALDYRQTRKSSEPAERGKHKGRIKKYDSSAEIMKMRKIGRRGLASESFSWMGNKVKGSGKKARVRHADAGRGGDKKKREEHARKWTRVTQKPEKYDAHVRLNNKLTYLTKHYGNLEPVIVNNTADFLVRETKRRIKAREAVAQRRMNKAA